MAVAVMEDPRSHLDPSHPTYGDASMFNARERVKKGVVWLDSVLPEWRDKIETDALEMENSCTCICGQAFAQMAKEAVDNGLYQRSYGTSGFWYANDELLPQSGYTPEELGFTIDDDLDPSEEAGSYEQSMKQWHALEDAWYGALGLSRGAVN